MDPLVLAVDSSTTATKALVVDAEGVVLATGRAPIRLLTPGPDRYEQDPAEWWESTRAAVGLAVAELSTEQRARVTALTITPQRQTFALVDEQRRALRPGIIWLDGRATAEVAELGSPEVHALSGFQPDVTPSLYKLAWLARNEPAVVESAAHLAGVHGYLVHALTGEWLDSQATADSFGLYEMASLEFSPRLVELAGLRSEQLPALVAPGSPMGEVRREVLEGWGLPGTVTVVAGCGDGQAAALGAGATRPDEAYLNLGTAVVAGVHSASYRYGSVYRTDAAGIPSAYVLEVVQNSGAYLAGWFRTELGDPALAGAPDPALELAAAEVPIGCGGLVALPYWNAVQSPHWDPVARGAFVGLSGVHTRAHLYRALLEGISLETARNLRGLEADTGVPLRSVRIMGGGQRSELWRRILADATGLTLTRCDVEEASAMGAAAQAIAYATGASVDETARRVATLGETTEPAPAAHEVYAELDTVQAGLYEALSPTFAAQHAFAARHPLPVQSSGQSDQ